MAGSVVVPGQHALVVVSQRSAFEQPVHLLREGRVEHVPAHAVPPAPRALRSEVDGDHAVEGLEHLLVDAPVLVLEPLELPLPNGCGEEVVQARLIAGVERLLLREQGEVRIGEERIELRLGLLGHAPPRLGTGQQIALLHLPGEVDERDQHREGREQFADGTEAREGHRWTPFPLTTRRVRR